MLLACTLVVWLTVHCLVPPLHGLPYWRIYASLSLSTLLYFPFHVRDSILHYLALTVPLAAGELQKSFNHLSWKWNWDSRRLWWKHSRAIKCPFNQAKSKTSARESEVRIWLCLIVYLFKLLYEIFMQTSRVHWGSPHAVQQKRTQNFKKAANLQSISWEIRCKLPPLWL